MNHPPVIFFGMLFTMACSWFGLVFMPQVQLGGLKPVEAQVTGVLYPQARPGLAQQGREVYRKLGCVTCHTQQVRPFGPDRSRFGPNPTVTLDFLFEQPAFIGTLRVGPDLANAGLRQPDALWHLKHFYDPKGVVPGSTMPPYPFLFEHEPVPSSGAASDAVRVYDDPALGPMQVVPRHEALALAAYVQSLKVDAHLFERPAPSPPPKPEGAENAATNSPAQSPAQ